MSSISTPQANLPNLRRLFVEARTDAEESAYSRTAVRKTMKFVLDQISAHVPSVLQCRFVHVFGRGFQLSRSKGQQNQLLIMDSAIVHIPEMPSESQLVVASIESTSQKWQVYGDGDLLRFLAGGEPLSGRGAGQVLGKSYIDADCFEHRSLFKREERLLGLCSFYFAV